MMPRGIPLLIPFLVLSCTAADSPPSAADLLLTNGRVYTLDWAEPDTEGSPAPDAPYDPEGGWHPDAQAIAVRDGEIVFVGSSPEAEAFRGPDTDVLDLKGATV
ncbi:MAG: hypothetical protein MUO50_16435, partial [Longimicrobiales bacterium]|nr:hypothetical protein [Longimicrobiales bacterium]